MESDAKSYGALNNPQYELGCGFIRSLNLTKGDKVLDMGCGTGDVTAFICDVVGQDGEVVGVEPDEARVKIARENFKDIDNVTFYVGDSMEGSIPKGYFDLHFSNCVFHWLQGNRKNIYLEKAAQCLKRGGRLAILTVVKHEVKFDPSFIERLTEEEYKTLVEESGLFGEVKTEMVRNISHFGSFEEFDAWLKASSHRNTEEMDPEWMKEFLKKYTRTEADGRFTMEINELVRITATKI